MKRFAILLIPFILTGAAVGQDSTDINFVRTLPFNKVFYADDQFLISQQIESGGWDDDTTYLVLCDNSDPVRPRELWRGLPVITDKWDFHLYPGVYADAIVRDNLIIAVSMYYCIGDIPETQLDVKLKIYNWQAGQVVYERYWELSGDLWDHAGYFVLPSQLILNDSLLIASLGCHGIYFFDISNPADLVELSHIDLPAGPLTTVGDRIYFGAALEHVERDGNRYDGIVSVDVSDVRNPEFLNDWTLFTERALSGMWRFNDVCSMGNTIITRFNDWENQETRLLFARQTDEDWLDSLGLSEEIFAEGGLAVVGNQLYVSDSDSLLIYELDDHPAMHRVNAVADSGNWAFGKIVVNGDWIYRMTIHDYYGFDPVHLLHKGPVAVEETTPAVPSLFAISSTYPNPFNSQTTINYTLPEAGNVQMDVVDLSGRSLHSELIPGSSGENSISLDAADLPAGIYWVSLGIEGQVIRTKIVYLK